jgi:preprotein translocase subunit SecE
VVEKVKHFMGEVKVEMKKVTWPTKAELKDATRVVIVASIILTAFIALVDQVLSNIIKLVFR